MIYSLPKLDGTITWNLSGKLKPSIMLSTFALSNKGTAIPGRRQNEHKFGRIISGCGSGRDVSFLLRTSLYETKGSCYKPQSVWESENVPSRNLSHSVDNLTNSTHLFVYLQNTLLGHVRQLSSAGSRHSNISFEITVSTYSVFSPNIQQFKKSNMCTIILTSPYTKQNNVYIYIYIYKGKAVLLQAWTGPEGS